ncbi:MAG: amidohydrolase family protein [Proteobacteria bacterium]|nr:amidohydrolase family protein [Pseudomonadota bacterium]
MSDKTNKTAAAGSRREFLKHTLTTGAGIAFVGCSLTNALADTTIVVKDPDTLQADFPRPVVVNGKRMLTIDVHAHTEVADVWPLIEGHKALAGENPYDPNPLSRATDVSVRIADMDATGIDMQALSISVGQYFHWAERDLAAKIIRLQNEKLAEVCALHPDRFVPLGAVSLQHPDLAASQLEYAVKKLGHRGVMITGSIDGLEIADSQFNPFWAKAEELDVIVFLHPRGFPEGGKRFQGNGRLGNIIGNPLETTVALSHLIFEGTLDRYPGLKLVAAHGGGFLPAYIGRSDHCHSTDDRGCRGEEQKKPSDYLQQIYFDSLVYNTQNLKHLIHEAGVSQIVLGTDYPYGMENRNAVAHVLSVPGLNDQERAAILGGTLSRLLKLDHD